MNDMLFEVIFQRALIRTSLFYNSAGNCEKIRLLKIDDSFGSTNLCVST